MVITLVRCDLCTDEESFWEQDDPTGKKLAAHKQRQHGISDGVITNEAVADLMFSDPKNDRARAVIEEAIKEDAAEHCRHVSSNRVREKLPPWINPRVVGSVYSVWIRRGLLVPDGELKSTDRRGRNGNKKLAAYRYTGPLS